MIVNPKFYPFFLCYYLLECSKVVENSDFGDVIDFRLIDSGHTVKGTAFSLHSHLNENPVYVISSHPGTALL